MGLRGIRAWPLCRSRQYRNSRDAGIHIDTDMGIDTVIYRDADADTGIDRNTDRDADADIDIQVVWGSLSSASGEVLT